MNLTTPCMLPGTSTRSPTSMLGAASGPAILEDKGGAKPVGEVSVLPIRAFNDAFRASSVLDGRARLGYFWGRMWRLRRR